MGAPIKTIESAMAKTITKGLFALLLLLLHTYSLANCSPPITGAPCAQGGIATMHNPEPAISLAAGNPVNLANGNKFQTETDMPANPNMPGLELVRHYNSFSNSNSPAGYGWSFSYDTRLILNSGQVQIIQSDGSRILFNGADLDSHNNSHGRHGTLTRLNNNYQWIWPSGTGLSFNAAGLLIAIRWPSGNAIYIKRYAYDHALAGAIDSVTDEAGNTLQFYYRQTSSGPKVSAVSTPLGRFTYLHDEKHRLIKASRPDKLYKSYIYDEKLQANNLYALTGISIGKQDSGASPETHSLWQYDANGRVIYSEVTDLRNNHHKLKFQYKKTASPGSSGLTIVTDQNNNKTSIEIASIENRFVITAVKGHGCYGCPAPGTTAAYDSSARLVKINNANIDRYPNGNIKALSINNNGWTNLQFSYAENGLRESWSTTDTGLENISYNLKGLPVLRTFANGDKTEIEYDALSRPTMIIDSNSEETVTTTLVWQSNRLIKVGNNVETEVREYDENNRIVQRHITRNEPEFKRTAYSEQFSYDADNRLIKHALPEGGYLEYQWGPKQQLMSVYWTSLDGKRHNVIRPLESYGYIHGNGLKTVSTKLESLNLKELTVFNDHRNVVTQHLIFDSSNRPISEAHNSTNYSYSHDSQGRLVGIKQIQPYLANDNTWYAWSQNGSARAINSKGKTVIRQAKHDASGLPTEANGLSLKYGANRRLQVVNRNGEKIAKYKHNAYGFRVSRSMDGTNSQYYYLENQLVGLKHYKKDVGYKNNSDLLLDQRFIYAFETPIALIKYSDANKNGELLYIHSSLQGAPVLVTDHEQQPIWQAHYSPFGMATIMVENIELDLRLPGQVFDKATGWHDNLLRTYDPAWGSYIEPDPLGPIPDSQAYGYAKQQPRIYTDPTGLLLFAFDGTRQSKHTNANVWQMSQMYQDGPAYYQDGPGNSMYIDWDALTAHQAKQIIDKQWSLLLLELSKSSPTETIPIDILGFSRGAALARHFSNLISQHVTQGMFQYYDVFFGHVTACVDLRFMGLFDSVAQFGLGGSQNHLYDLTISPAWEWVAHAVALHERRWLFPLLSASDTGAYNVVEAPFIGSHSDIGGGVYQERNSDEHIKLSDITMQWMLWQASAATVKFNNPGINVANKTAILNDFRSTVARSIQDGDRAVQSSAARPLLNYQDYHPRLGRNTRNQTEQFINRPENWRRLPGSEVGEVNMQGYSQWLNEVNGWTMPPV